MEVDSLVLFYFSQYGNNPLTKEDGRIGNGRCDVHFRKKQEEFNLKEAASCDLQKVKLKA